MASVVLTYGERLFGQRMMDRLRFLQEAQWWPKEKVATYRDQRLRELVQTAYREVPFYKSLFNGSGVRPGEIQSIADLPNLPVLTKAALRAAPPASLVRATGQRVAHACSSGSTGEPIRIAEDARTAGEYRAAFLLALEWAGFTPGMPHVQTGMNLKRDFPRRLKDVLLRCHYVSAFDLTDDHLDKTLAAMESKGIRFLFGYPGSLYMLARRARTRGWSVPLTSVVTWGDMLFPRYRSEMEEVFSCRVFDTYGVGEGIQVAAQCGHGSTYHVFDTEVIVEFVGEDGGPVEPGQGGRMLLTRLHPGPTPLIRYEVGDIGVRGKDAPCSCGRELSILVAIEGRDTDIVVTPSGNRLIVHFFTGILEYYREVAAFQVVQQEVASVTLRIVPGPGYNERIQARILEDLKVHGADCEIRVELVDAIPLSSNGKRRFVVSRIARAAQDSR